MLLFDFVHRCEKYNIVIIVCLYLLLLFSSGFFFRAFNGSLAIAMLFAVCGVLFVRNRSGIFFSPVQIVPVFLLLILFLVSSLFAEDELKYIGINLSYLLIAFFLSNILSPQQYFSNYTKLMDVIEIFSLICFVVVLISPSFFSIFPLLAYQSGRSAHFALLSFVYTGTALNRNYGIFWEPGAFQFFIIFSMVVKIYFLRKGLRSILIDIVCVLTTFSSIGFIALILFLVMFLNRYKGLFNRFLQVFICLFAVIGMNYLYNNLSYDLKYAYFEKNIVAMSEKSDDESISTRQRSIYYTLNVIKKSPVLGNGVSGFSEYSMNTMTTLNWFARYGAIFGMIMLYGLWKFYASGRKSKLETVELFILSIVVTSTEEFSMNPVYLLPIMYGLKTNREFLLYG